MRLTIKKGFNSYILLKKFDEYDHIVHNKYFLIVLSFIENILGTL